MNTTGIAASTSSPAWLGKLSALNHDDIGQRENASQYEGDLEDYPLPASAADEGAREIRAALNED